MLQIGEVIDGKYKVLNTIGQGGMSVVYLAMNEKANKQWAIKEVRKDGIQDFEVVKQGLVTEIEMLKRFSHPNLPTIVDVIEDPQRLLIVMDYIQGNPLSKALEEYGAQPQENVIVWAKQLCDVLNYLHTRTPPIVYRDMKPQNIMLKPDGNVSLIDFGTAREFKEKNLADTTCLGTRGYAAPEQFGGMGQTDARTDIYCLGATIYHLVTGQNPCEPPYEILPIRSINPSLSGGLEKIIVKCTKQNPDERYQSCAELMYALEHYEEIDVIFRKAQKKKLIRFAVAAALSLIFAGTSAFGYDGAQKKESENYEKILRDAFSTTLPQEERETLLIQAIGIDPTNERAYNNLLELFKSGSEEADRIFSQRESSIISELENGLNVTDQTPGSKKRINPLDDFFKKENPEKYADFCFKLANLYWYDFEVVADRERSAVGWFEKALDGFPIAQIYIDIATNYKLIEEYDGNDQTSKMYSEYVKLWPNYLNLEKEANLLDEFEDEKFLVWKQIVLRIDESPAEFLEVTNDKQTIIDFLNIISENASNERKTAREAMKKKLGTLLEDIEKLKFKISTYKQPGG